MAFTVVGVVGDVRSTALTQESPALYYPMLLAFVAAHGRRRRIRQHAGSVASLNPSEDARTDAELALANVRTMEEWLSNSAAPPRLNTVLLSAFPFVALLIASIGIYGVLAYSVVQRTGEIGVRMALGATPRGVLQLIVGEGMKVALIGIGIGLLGGLALGRAVSSLVFGVPVRDPATLLGVAVALAGVAFAAGVVPALRASRVDPIVALRYE